MALGRLDKRNRDLDNAATKAALDLVDDSLVTSITSSWDAKVPAGRILIVVRALWPTQRFTQAVCRWRRFGSLNISIGWSRLCSSISSSYSHLLMGAMMAWSVQFLVSARLGSGVVGRTCQRLRGNPYGQLHRLHLSTSGGR